MKTKTTTESRRTYDSPLRAEQAEATRQRIVAAAHTLVKRGDRELSFAAVSKEAKVAIATVYRHFPERRDLLVALSQRLETAEGHARWVGLGLDEVKAGMRERYATYDEPGPQATHLEHVRQLYELSRMTSVPVRRAIFAFILRERAPALPDAERDRLADLSAVLSSSAMIEVFCGYLGCSATEAVEHVCRSLDAVLALASQPPESP